MRAKRVYACCAAIALIGCGVPASGQMTIDATGTPHNRVRNPESGSMSGDGATLPAVLTFQVVAATEDGQHLAKVEFTITNKSASPLVLPISPNSLDIEPKDSASTYSDVELSLSVRPSPESLESYAGGAELYGSEQVPHTLITLSQGEGLRVLANEALPLTSDGKLNTAIPITGFLILNTETVRYKEGHTILEMHNVGTADTRNLPQPEIIF